MIEEHIYSYFANYPNLVGDAIYPQIAPDNTPTPYITYTVVYGKPKELSSISNKKISSIKTRIQIDVYDSSSYATKQLRDRVVLAIRSFPYYSSDVNWRDGYEPRVKFYRQIIEFYTRENTGECNNVN